MMLKDDLFKQGDIYLARKVDIEIHFKYCYVELLNRTAVLKIVSA